jgi:hypothetical protein
MHTEIDKGADYKNCANALLHTKHLIKEQNSCSNIQHWFDSVDYRGGVWSKDLKAGEQSRSAQYGRENGKSSNPDPT